MEFEGRISTWHDDRGFGFITPAQGGDEIFFHIKALKARSGRPQPGQQVLFSIDIGPQGKKRARWVKLQRPVPGRHARRRDSPAQWGTATLFALPGFVVLYFVLHVAWRPPLLLAGVYLGLSLVTFLAYAADKSAAERRAWRTPEDTLHLLALAGGWPGALLAQQWLRHKSHKRSFRTRFWGTVVLNIVILVALCSPWAQGLWRRA